MPGLTFFTVTGDYHAVDDPDASSADSSANVEAVQGLVSFTPRVPKGFVAFVDEFDIRQDANSLQTVTMIGAITGGTWGLNVNGVWMDPYVPAGASAAAVQAALAAIPGVGTGNVTVTKAAGVGTPYVCEFVGALGNAPQNQMLADDSQLVASSGTPHVSVVVVHTGATQKAGDTSISLPVRHGRIWTTGELSAINAADSPTVELTANVDLGIDYDLIYDVAFTAVRFNGENQNLAPFGFVAPTDATPVCITDPALDRVLYATPLQETWYPGWEPKPVAVAAATGTVTPMRDWRQRSA